MPEMMLFDLPFLFRDGNMPGASRTAKSARIFSTAGFQNSSASYWKTASEVFSNFPSIPEDSRQKIRVMENAGHMRSFEASARFRPMAYGELFTHCSRNHRRSGKFLICIATDNSTKLRQPRVTGHFYGIVRCFMSKSVFEKLTRAAEYLKKRRGRPGTAAPVYRRQRGFLYKSLKESGMNITEPDRKRSARLRAIYSDFIFHPKEMIDAVSILKISP